MRTDLAGSFYSCTAFKQLPFTPCPALIFFAKELLPGLCFWEGVCLSIKKSFRVARGHFHTHTGGLQNSRKKRPAHEICVRATVSVRYVFIYCVRIHEVQCLLRRRRVSNLAINTSSMLLPASLSFQGRCPSRPIIINYLAPRAAHAHKQQQ